MAKAAAARLLRTVIPKERQFSDNISELKDEYLMCRIKGHAWEHVTDYILVSYKGEPREIQADYRCSRCKTEMEELLMVPSFDLKRRKYFYSPGYLLSKQATHGKGVNIRDLREERLVRAKILKG